MTLNTPRRDNRFGTQRRANLLAVSPHTRLPLVQAPPPLYRVRQRSQNRTAQGLVERQRALKIPALYRPLEHRLFSLETAPGMGMGAAPHTRHRPSAARS
eukprot:TRINITY_DN3163_c0_g1_i1.p6 TRINITY_DN3163_c0_g1~~TRINITY_DN3163_c0_g1_i1.p6  ORF type:complete len:100 (+),score=7.50 TRINITY_DN3163_c0_g1_i1:1503-1802(+)